MAHPSLPPSPYGYQQSSLYPPSYRHLAGATPYMPTYILPTGMPIPYTGFSHFTTPQAEPRLSLDIRLLSIQTTVLPPSSPVETGDLSDYIHWQISRSPKDKKAYLKALQILESWYYNLQTIQGWKGLDHEDKWEKLGIEPGIGIRIARDLSKWAKLSSKIVPDYPTFPREISPPPKKLPVVTKHPVPSKTPATIITPQRSSPTISRVLAKLATRYEDDKVASTEQELDSVEETDEDLAFQELDEFLEEDEILDGQQRVENRENILGSETESETDSNGELV